MARLDFKQVVAAVAVLVAPFADGITGKSRLDVLRPFPSVGIDSSMRVVDVIDQDIGDSGKTMISIGSYAVIIDGMPGARQR